LFSFPLLRQGRGFCRTFNEIAGVKPGIVAFYNQDISGKGNNQAGLSAKVDWNGLCLEITGTQNSKSHDIDSYVSLTYTFPLSKIFGDKK